MRWPETREQYGARLSEHIRQDCALDRPFYEMEAAKHMARCGAEPREARPAPLGLVFNATKVTRVLIDRDLNRVKRLRTNVHHAARMLDFTATADGRCNRKFLTLTYADADGWEPGHIGAFTRRLREWCKRRGVQLRQVWVAELQQRGALHYHVVVWLPRGVFLPRPDQCGWWPHGSSNVQTAKNPVGYLAKYASKTGPLESQRFPSGARMFGAAGLESEDKRALRYWRAPFWVRDALTGRADIRKVRGGYADALTGEYLGSPWSVIFEPGGLVYAVRKETDDENSGTEPTRH